MMENGEMTILAAPSHFGYACVLVEACIIFTDEIVSDTSYMCARNKKVELYPVRNCSRQITPFITSDFG